MLGVGAFRAHTVFGRGINVSKALRRLFHADARHRFEAAELRVGALVGAVPMVADAVDGLEVIHEARLIPRLDRSVATDGGRSGFNGSGHSAPSRYRRTNIEQSLDLRKKMLDFTLANVVCRDKVGPVSRGPQLSWGECPTCADKRTGFETG
jgi:hypothetical protein